MSSSSITVCSVDFVAEEGEVTCEEQAYCMLNIMHIMSVCCSLSLGNRCRP